MNLIKDIASVAYNYPQAFSFFMMSLVVLILVILVVKRMRKTAKSGEEIKEDEYEVGEIVKYSLVSGENYIVTLKRNEGKEIVYDIECLDGLKEHVFGVKSFLLSHSSVMSYDSMTKRRIPSNKIFDFFNENKFCHCCGASFSEERKSRCLSKGFVVCDSCDKDYYDEIMNVK